MSVYGIVAEIANHINGKMCKVRLRDTEGVTLYEVEGIDIEKGDELARELMEAARDFLSEKFGVESDGMIDHTKPLSPEDQARHEMVQREMEKNTVH